MRPGILVAPLAIAIPNIAVGITPAATQSLTYFGGSALGPQLSYGHLYDFAWWVGSSGWNPHPGTGGKIARVLKGIEDSDNMRMQ